MNAYPPQFFVDHCEARRWVVGDPGIITYETASGQIDSILGTMIDTDDDDFDMIYVAADQSGVIPAEPGRSQSYDPELGVQLLQVRKSAIKEIAQVFAREYFEDDEDGD